MSAAALSIQFVSRYLFILSVAVLCFLPLEKADASTKTSPERELSEHNLKTDEASLLAYLDSGLPEVPSLSFDRRWVTYRWVVMMLGEISNEESVLPLIRFIETEPSGKLEQDLLLSVASGLDWKRWDFQCAQALAQIRGDAAFALAKIGDARALPVLTAYLERLAVTVEADMASEHPDSSILSPYGVVCKAITALGSKAGIDALVDSLGRFTEPSPEKVVYNLRICSGQIFGPEVFQPSHLWPAIFAEWRAWWQENRASFEIDRERVLHLKKPELPRPEPISLREHVVAAETRSFDYEGTGYGKRSAEWLEASGDAHVDELAAILEDRNEDGLVRREAMKWYVASNKPGGNGESKQTALNLLIRYAIGEDTYSAQGYDRMLLQGEALNLIAKHYPEALDGVAKRCVVSKDYRSSNAVHLLMKSEGNHRFIAEKYDSLKGEGRRQALHALLQLSEPIGRSAYITALNSADPYEAVYGARGVAKFGLEADMPDESLAALSRWRTDPTFRILIIEDLKFESDEDRVAAVLALLSEVNAADAAAASVYRRAWHLLPPESRGIAMEGLLRCVAAYKESRGM